MMKDKPQDASPKLTLAERRKRLADALGSLLARAWLREHGPAVQNQQASAEPEGQQVGSAENPP